MWYIARTWNFFVLFVCPSRYPKIGVKHMESVCYSDSSGKIVEDLKYKAPKPIPVFCNSI